MNRLQMLFYSILQVGKDFRTDILMLCNKKVAHNHCHVPPLFVSEMSIVSG